MRRVLPLALLSAACSLRPWTPSVSVAYWGEPVPPPRAMPLPSTATVSERWRLPTEDPWGRYSKVTLLSSLDSMAPDSELPDVRDLEVVREAADAANHVAQTALPKGVLWLVDLRGAASVAFGATLSLRAAAPVSPVLTFNNWPDASGMVPAEETLAGCVQFAPKLDRPAGGAADALERHPVFMLDSWRLAYRDDEVDEDTYDNRYGLGAADLPSPETLREAGISRVMYVVEDLDDTDKEEDDLNAIFLAYQSHGIGIYMVDLKWLRGLERDTSWPRAFVGRAMWVRPRVTILSSPWFYQRSLGGFGGFRAHPIHVGPSGGRGGGGHGGGG